MKRGKPVIAITPDTHRHKPQDAAVGRYRYELTTHYSRAVMAAGGVPVILPFENDAIDRYLALADGVILSGGDDPDMAMFGGVTHPKARVMAADRQRFEMKLLESLEETRHPVLGICLGMQLMALHAGGDLHQHMPDPDCLGEEVAGCHDHQPHGFRLAVSGHSVLADGEVYSHHHQAVSDSGRLRVVGVSDDETGGVIEAIDNGEQGGRFYLGVQWHPELTAGPLGEGVIGNFVDAARGFGLSR